MTTASLSGLLTRVGSLTDADVRELEKLADSYPYCQTSHLLLAKALHDRGSVLAGQKLRRAATGAPDRRALRRLLLMPSPGEASAETGADTSPAPALAVSAAGELVSHSGTSEAVAPGNELTVEAPAAEAVEEAPAAPPPVEATEQLQEAPSALESVAEANPVPVADFELAPTAAGDGAAALSSEPPEAFAEAPELPTTVLADFDLVPDTGPATVELLLFEADEHAAPAGLTLLPAEALVPVVLLPDLAPDPAVAYWLPSSRLGAELTAADFAPTAADGTADPALAVDLTYAWLPEAPPDARWTEHAAAHQPPAPEPGARRPFDHQFALIDRFLRDKPRLRNVDPTRPLPEKLPDLALKSTRPDDAVVVSESIARILARQGKTARAVAMYEQLQARLPEKAAIFAAQIAALRGAAGPG